MEQFRPEGHRLGIAVATASPTPSLGALEDALRAHGLSPSRRLARLRPRLGEQDVRTDDVVDFLSRYGHEYALFVVPADAPDPDMLAAAARAAGCEVVVEPRRG